MTNKKFFLTNLIWAPKSAEFDADIKFVELVFKNAPTISYRAKNIGKI
jgi:hypothetical protein